MGVQPYRLLLSGLPLGCVASSRSPSLSRRVGELGLRAQLDPKNQTHLSCIRAHVASWGMGCALCWQRLPLGKSEQPLSLQESHQHGHPLISQLPVPIQKRGNAKECSNYCTIVLISHGSKVMLKILQARLQQYVNKELSDVQAEFRKGRGSRDQIANICWLTAREFQKNTCFVDYTKAFDCADHNKLWKILKEMGISDHLTCLLKNLYAGQEAIGRTRHGTTDCFKIGKGIC